MAYLCVDGDGSELIFNDKPHRDNFGLFWCIGYYIPQNQVSITLPSGSIAKLIGRELTWEDEPIKIE